MVLARAPRLTRLTRIREKGLIETIRSRIEEFRKRISPPRF